MYEPPIHLHYDYADPQKIQELYVKEQERYIVKCCMNMGVTVDRDELIKALQYDRGQYEKGFDDGRAEGYRAGVEEAKERYLLALSDLMERRSQ